MNQSSDVFLDEVLPYDDLIKDSRINSERMVSIISILKQSNPTQYEKMMAHKFSEDLDTFTSNLSNPLYLKKVFNYTLMEINKSARYHDKIDPDDMDIPKHQVESAAPHDRSESHKRMEKSNVFPLKIGQDQISIHNESHDKLWDIYYEIDENDEVSLIAYDGHEACDYDGSKIAMIYSRGLPLLSKDNGHNLYFSFNQYTAVLVIYMPTPMKKDEYTILKRIYFHQYHKTPP
jgi:hypothetical protein